SICVCRRPTRTTPFPYTTLFRSAPANERTASINSAIRISHSAFGSALKHRRLFSAPGRRESEMSVRGSRGAPAAWRAREEALLRSEEHTSELQSPDHLVCRLLLE